MGPLRPVEAPRFERRPALIERPDGDDQGVQPRVTTAVGRLEAEPVGIGLVIQEGDLGRPRGDVDSTPIQTKRGLPTSGRQLSAVTSGFPVVPASPMTARAPLGNGPGSPIARPRPAYGAGRRRSTPPPIASSRAWVTEKSRLANTVVQVHVTREIEGIAASETALFEQTGRHPGIALEGNAIEMIIERRHLAALVLVPRCRRHDSSGLRSTCGGRAS